MEARKDWFFIPKFGEEDTHTILEQYTIAPVDIDQIPLGKLKHSKPVNSDWYPTVAVKYMPFKVFRGSNLMSVECEFSVFESNEESGIRSLIQQRTCSIISLPSPQSFDPEDHYQAIYEEVEAHLQKKLQTTTLYLAHLDDAVDHLVDLAAEAIHIDSYFRFWGC